MKVRAAYFLMAVACLPATGCSFLGEVVTGSGTPATGQFDVAGFTKVEAHGAFQVEIVRADKFDVSVTTDDNLLEFVKVTEDNGTLTIGLENGKNFRSRAGFKATIAMPALEGIQLEGACTGSVKGFDGCKTFSIELQGASTLTGEVDADELNIVADGASTVTLQGTAKEGIVRASGASKIHLSDLALVRADIHFSGACSGTVHVMDKLDYELSGASHLDYRGRPTLGNQDASGASSATQK
jgi:hypothetical protein